MNIDLTCLLQRLELGIRLAQEEPVSLGETHALTTGLDRTLGSGADVYPMGELLPAASMTGVGHRVAEFTFLALFGCYHGIALSLLISFRLRNLVYHAGGRGVSPGSSL